MESRWTLVRDDQGAPTSILVINTDVTEKKRMESQFLRAQRMESIGTLAGGIAHDLNNVLSPILMAIDMLQLKATDEASKKVAGSPAHKCRARWQHGAAGVVVCQRSRRRTGGLAAKTSDQRRSSRSCVRPSRSQSRSISHLPDDLWIISADATQMHQVLMNLCVNARDAMPEGGSISIKAENTVVDENYARMHIEAKAGPFCTDHSFRYWPGNVAGNPKQNL